jgi:hypothetical protein
MKRSRWPARDPQTNRALADVKAPPVLQDLAAQKVKAMKHIEPVPSVSQALLTTHSFVFATLTRL